MNPLFWVLLFLVLAYLRLRNARPNPFTGWRGFLSALYFKKAQSHLFKAIIILFIFGNSVIANELLLWWETPMSAKKIHLDTNLPRTAVVLGGFGRYNPKTKWYRLNESPERLSTGMEGLIYQRFDVLILSGGNSEIFDKRFFGANNAKNFLGRFQLDTSKVISEILSRNTIENAIYTKKILDSLNITDSILLITSATHMPRSMACYKKLGIKFIPYPVQQLANEERNYSLDSYIIPSSNAMSQIQTLLHEWVGMLSYKISGKID